MLESRKGGRAVYGNRYIASKRSHTTRRFASLCASFLQSQINRYVSQGAEWCDSSIAYLTSTQPDDKVIHVVGVAQAYQRKRTHVLRSQMQCSVCSRSLVIHAWPHDTVRYHSSGKSKLHGVQFVEQTLVDYCLLPCCATQYEPTPLGKRQEERAAPFAFPSAAREILCHCCTAFANLHGRN